MTESPEPEVLAPGLWAWSRRHPEWHPGAFGAEVVSFMALAADGETLLVDPLLAGDDDPAWERIESDAGPRIRVLITIPYHVRSAEPIRDRIGPDRVTIYGHPSVAKRLGSKRGFEAFSPGDHLPGGVSVHPVGKPRRYETPLLLSSHHALVFGDAVVGTGEGPRMWAQEPLDDRVLRFYRERFGPSLEPLLDLRFDRLLMTHGPSLLEDGRQGLRDAVAAAPWYHRPT